MPVAEQTRTELWAAPWTADAQRLLLHDISWQKYEMILQALDERPIRLTYDRGILEIMTLSPEHEEYKHVFVLLIAILAQELKIPMKGRGSMTFRRQDLERGLEPDECYWITNEPLVRGKKQLDFTRDPPPDLVVEIDIASSSRGRMDLYAALGVPEVWRFDGQALQIYLLGAGAKYQAVDKSPSFPLVPISELARFVTAAGSTDETTLMEAFRGWLRQQLGKG